MHFFQGEDKGGTRKSQKAITPKSVNRRRKGKDYHREKSIHEATPAKKSMATKAPEPRLMFPSKTPIRSVQRGGRKPAKNRNSRQNMQRLPVD